MPHLIKKRLLELAGLQVAAKKTSIMKAAHKIKFLRSKNFIVRPLSHRFWANIGRFVPFIPIFMTAKLHACSQKRHKTFAFSNRK